MTHSDIPLFPVFRRGQQDTADILASMNAIVETGDFIGFSAVDELEAHLEEKFRIDHAVGLSSGTAAIQGLFEYFDISDRDMVVVPAWTFFASASVPCDYTKNVFVCDVDPETFLIDVDKLSLILERQSHFERKFVMVVDVFGNICDYPKLRELQQDIEFTLFSDSAQSFGGTVAGKYTHEWVDYTTYSFYPTKPLSGIADGGLVATRDAACVDYLKNFRNQGQCTTVLGRKVSGFNYRMSGSNAKMLQLRSDRLTQMQEKIWQNFASLKSAMGDNLTVQKSNQDVAPATTFMPVIAKDGDDLIRHMGDKGIEARAYYNKMLWEYPSLENLQRNGNLEVSEGLKGNVVALPCHDMLSEDELNRIRNALAEYRN
ncbi:MAG: aminotransferase class I/II-fold pyridoxal phosphate-dependent enzyme [Fimbriimonadaceae bacterium]|nr:aminotransferase class I/II-fold pyridoxal phosphate-dependent enzyme [Alphaproteobacteria bacterium]